MIIDGRLIAAEIKSKLQKEVSLLSSKGIIPHLSIILVGSDPSSLAYIRQKKKVGEEIGARISLTQFPQEIQLNKLLKLLKNLNADPAVHGIIIQKPVPLPIEKEELNRLVIPQKDVDGFHPDSPFLPPVGEAVMEILKWVFNNEKAIPSNLTIGPFSLFNDWLNNKVILILGRGETAGAPIAKTLSKSGISFTIAHSKTNNRDELMKSADVIISCVGKAHIVRHDFVSQKAILIGVGLHSERDKLRSDYEVEDIKDRVMYYTPTPGGVGPVNVACLIKNVVSAANDQTP